MPKTRVNETEIAYCGPSSRGVFRKYKLRMVYDGPILSYRKNRWVKLEFKKVVAWRAEPAVQPYVGQGPIALEQMPKIILETTGTREKESRTFAFHPRSFEDWLYRIIRALLLHSEAPVPDEYFSHLTPKHRVKVETRNRIKFFDRSHEVFVGVVQRLDQQGPVIKKEETRYKKKPFQTAFEIETPEEILAQTRSGMKYGNVVRKIGKGGSATVIYEINKLKAALVKNTEGGGYKIVREAEPMAAKSVCSPYDVTDKMDLTALEEVIKEARVMTALGEHPNIVGLIDAHVLSTEKSGFRVFLFMEKGYHTLEAYEKGEYESYSQTGQKEIIKVHLSPPLIRKYVVGILSGIGHMHQHRIYHLDMKPENVIICKADIPKIIDFGLSKGKLLYTSKAEMFDEKWKAFGTKGYISPECYDSTISKEVHLIKKDSYAVGMVILNALLAPFFRWSKPNIKSGPVENKELPLQRIAHWEKKVRQEGNLEKNGLFEVAEMALAMIHANPEARLTVQDARDFIVDHLSRRRRQRGKVTVSGPPPVRSPRRNVPQSSTRVKPRTAQAKTIWRCRNCNQTFPYKPMQCTCLLYSHPDGDPLFVRA